MKYATQENTEFSGRLGHEIDETVKEVFWWFYSGDGKETKTCTIRHLNGVKITFEREP